MVILNPPLSFLQFDGDASFEYPIPIRDETDLKFQLVLEFDSVDEASDFMAGGDAYLYVMEVDVDVSDSVSRAASQLIYYADLNPPVLFSKVQVSERQVLLYWDAGLPGLHEVVPVDGCFALMLEVAQPSASPGYYKSNPLYRIGSDRPSSALEYSCEEDAYGFRYCGGFFPNRFRLPFYLTRPQFQDDESVYVRSDGSRKVLKSVSRKEYQCMTDLLPESWHERLKMALSHDFVEVHSGRYVGGISKSGGYEIEWPEFMDFEGAPAKFKVLVTPYNMRNSNCATCQPWECLLVAEITDIAGEDGPPNVPVSVYGMTYTVTGGPPEELVLEYSTDGGATWALVNLRAAPVGATYDLYYDIGQYNHVPHQLRLTPLCEAGLQGTPGINYIS